MQAVEEPTRIVEVFDHLACHHDVGGRDPDGADGVDVAAVDCVRLVPPRACVGDTRLVEIEAHELRRDAREVLVEPSARLLVELLTARVDEADVDDAAVVGHLARGTRSDRRATPAAGGAPSRAARSRGQTSLAVTSCRRSASGGPARPRSTLSTLANARRRLYQSSRLPQPTGVGHHPELLVGIEVVGVAVDPEQLAPTDAAPRRGRRRARDGAQVDAAEVGEPEALRPAPPGTGARPARWASGTGWWGASGRRRGGCGRGGRSTSR